MRPSIHYRKHTRSALAHHQILIQLQAQLGRALEERTHHNRAVDARAQYVTLWCEKRKSCEVRSISLFKFFFLKKKKLTRLEYLRIRI